MNNEWMKEGVVGLIPARLSRTVTTHVPSVSTGLPTATGHHQGHLSGGSKVGGRRSSGAAALAWAGGL